MLRERLLKGIADDLPMKKTFDEWADFLRDESSDMDDKGKGNEEADCVATTAPYSRSGFVPSAIRGRGTQERGRGNQHPRRGADHRGGSAPHGGQQREGHGRGMPTSFGSRGMRPQP